MSGVVHSVDAATNTVRYLHNFTDGSYQVEIEAKETAGSTGTQSWSFVVDSSPPQISSVEGVTDGMEISDGTLQFSAKLTDMHDIKDNVAVRDWYLGEMTAAGWALHSDSFTTGATHFELTYQKGRRYCVIWYYSGSIPNTEGSNPKGSRLQIAYH